MQFEHKPVMTRDGKTMIHPSAVWSVYRRQSGVRPESEIAGLLRLIEAGEPLADHASIEVVHPLARVDYEMPSLYSQIVPRVSYETYVKRMQPILGATLISGNFEKLSRGFRITTRDERLIQAFANAFAWNRRQHATANA
jgi:hypothetical protein